MENDLFETIRQHYNGIDVKRLKKRANGAKNEAASRLGLIPPIPFIEWWRIKNTPEYKKEIAYIYTQISSCEKYVADDLQTIHKYDLYEGAEREAERKDLFDFLVWLNKWCKEYHELVEGTEYDLQPMQAATDTAAALPDSLKTDKAKRAFEIAKERGYIIEVGNHYKWNLSSKVLLAYFLGRLLGDKVEYDTVAGKYRWLQSEILPTKTIEALFDCKNVGQSRYNNKLNNGFVPKGAALIDDIINKL